MNTGLTPISNSPFIRCGSILSVASFRERTQSPGLTSTIRLNSKPLFWLSEFGIWDLFGICYLEIGISSADTIGSSVSPVTHWPKSAPPALAGARPPIASVRVRGTLGMTSRPLAARPAARAKLTAGDRSGTGSAMDFETVPSFLIRPLRPMIRQESPALPRLTYLQNQYLPSLQRQRLLYQDSL